MATYSNTYRVGDVTITRVGELILENFTPKSLFPDWDAKVLEDHQSWLSPGSMDGSFEHALMSVHTWIVRTKNHTILIDPGVGNDKTRPFTPAFDSLHTPFLEKLYEAGVKPETVDYVLMTHLHVDHVGWNTHLVDGRWMPTFPNARYVFSQKEYEYYKDPANHNDRNKTSVIIQHDSIRPIIEAGLAVMINIDGSEFIDGLSFQSTPGHSFDHSTHPLNSYHVEKRPYLLEIFCITLFKSIILNGILYLTRFRIKHALHASGRSNMRPSDVQPYSALISLKVELA